MKTKSENGIELSTKSTEDCLVKKAYRAPSLTIYGDLRKLTLRPKGAGRSDQNTTKS
jgi:hypothetical protein